MTREGPETKLVRKMRKDAGDYYGDRLVTVKYHGDMMGEAGVSDLLCCLDGVFIAAEVKAPESYRVKGQPSVERAVAEGATLKQQAFIQRIVRAGGIGGVVASVEGYMALLEQAEYLSGEKV